LDLAEGGAAGCSFAVDFEHRACNQIKRGDVVKVLAEAVPAPPYKVNLDKPDKTILVQLVRNVCAVAVVEHFKELCKFNVRKVVESEEKQEQQQEVVVDGDAKADLAAADEV
jgi:tRNA(Ser,Leu) C12 N-acetylase TAN1